MGLALSTAVIVDFAQIVLGIPGALLFLDDGLDLIAAGIIMFAVGFHPLLLPTFLIELVPMVDMLPTWTACTLAVLALRKRAESNSAPPPPVAPDPEKMKRAVVIEEPPPSSPKADHG
jgi:hypothetical protein